MKTAFFSAALVLACTGSASALVLYANDFGANDGGFTTTNGGMAPGNAFTYAAGGWTVNGETTLGTPSTSEITSPAIAVPATGAVSLDFDHRYNFEFSDSIRWDGGQVQISVNGGAFAMVTSASFTANGYVGTLGGNGVLNGTDAFNDISAGYDTPAYITSSANLGTFNAGDSLRVRFIVQYDEFVRGNPDDTIPGWDISGVTVSGVPEPGTAMTGLLALGLLTVRRRR